MATKIDTRLLIEIAQQPTKKAPRLRLDVPRTIPLYSQEFGALAVAYMCGVRSREKKNTKLGVCGEVTRSKRGMTDHQTKVHKLAKPQRKLKLK